MSEHNYRERWQKAFAAFKAERGIDFCIPVSAFMEFEGPTPKHGDRWGDWEYNAKVMVLTYEPEDYEIDLEQCTTSAQTMDRIFQIAGKVWGTSQVLGDLVQAMQDLLRPQANLCSFGMDTKFNVAAHLKTFTGKRSGTRPS